MMKSRHTSLLRGLTVQLFVVTILPLTLLLLVIAFGSFFLHQRDMRSLVGTRDERGVQSAAAALSSELHHRVSNIPNLVVLAELSGDTNAVIATPNLASDFRGGLAYLGKDRQVLSATKDRGLWTAALKSTFAFPSRRGRPRVAFGRIVEAGLVKPDQMLYFGWQNAIRARVRANGAIAYDGFEGSIHQVGRKITNAPCNGWEHWYYEDSQGERRPINDLREIYLRMQIAG